MLEKSFTVSSKDSFLGILKADLGSRPEGNFLSVWKQVTVTNSSPGFTMSYVLLSEFTISSVLLSG
jgi:hypothetical protein